MALKVGKKLNVPWVNLAEGGSSNYDIALQPIQHMDDKPSNKPLFIFGFTGIIELHTLIMT